MQFYYLLNINIIVVISLSLLYENLQAKVDRVIIDGVARTKDDIVVRQVLTVFESDSFEDVSTCRDIDNIHDIGCYPCFWYI